MVATTPCREFTRAFAGRSMDGSLATAGLQELVSLSPFDTSEL